MKIKFIDGSVKEYPEGSSALAIAKSISPSLAKKAVFAKVDGKDYDLTRPLAGATPGLEIITRGSIPKLSMC